MNAKSLFQHGTYTLEWVMGFYDQTGIWWGPNTDFDMYEQRVEIVARLCGPGPWRILDLGTGPGGTAAALADAGHTVVAVELSPTRVQYAHELAQIPRRGSLTVIEADFYTVELDGCFDVVTYWDSFGTGTDADQRRLLRRISRDWLAPHGVLLMDVFHPAGPTHDAGSERRLAPLPGVPGSVEMLRRCHFDPLHCRWIDEWVPTAEPAAALAQTLRCYTPADFILLLEGTGLELDRVEVDGQGLDFGSNRITDWQPLARTYSFLTKLRRAADPS